MRLVDQKRNFGLPTSCKRYPPSPLLFLLSLIVYCGRAGEYEQFEKEPSKQRSCTRHRRWASARCTACRLVILCIF